MPLAKAAAISGVVTTAASGWPLPIGLPIVTMSGTTPCVSKPQKRLADAAEADLDLVGDADGAGRAGVPVGGGEVAGRQLDLAAARQQALAEEGRGRLPVERSSAASRDVGRELLAARGVLAPVEARGSRRASGRLRTCGGRPLSAGPVELVGADVDERLRVAVVGAVDDDDRRAGPSGAGQPQRELVGLAARADEEADRERLGQRRREPLRVAHDRGVEVARVGVQDRHLPLPGRDDARVRVADVGDVVDHVEERPARLVVEEGARAAHDLERRAGRRARATGRAGAGARRGCGRASSAGARNGQPGTPQDEVGVRARARATTARSLAAPTPGKSPSRSEHVRDDLEVDVGRPVAVAGRRADRADALAARDRRPGRQRPRSSRASGGRRACRSGARPRARARGSPSARSRTARRCRGRRERVPASGAKTGEPGSMKMSTAMCTVRRSGCSPRGAGEGVAAVDEAGLVVAADPDVRAPLAHRVEEPGRHRRVSRGSPPGVRNSGLADREVEDDGLREVRGDDGRRSPPGARRATPRSRASAGRGPPAGVRGARSARSAGCTSRMRASASQAGASLTRRYALSGSAVRRCAERQTLVQRRIAASVQSDLELRRPKAGGPRRSRRRRARRPRGGPPGRRPRRRSRPRARTTVHVSTMSPKSRSPGDRALGRRGRRRADEHVVVVAVVVDDAARQAPAASARTVDSKRRTKASTSSRRAGSAIAPAWRAMMSVRAFGVPGEVAADGRRMREARERDVEPAEEMACALEERRVARRRVRRESLPAAT